MKTAQLLQELVEMTEVNISEAKKFKNLNQTQLNQRRTEKSWSILECLEHLNLYGDFYIPEINTQLASSNYTPSENYKSGWLGNYFAKSMLPKVKLNTMKTFANMNPINSQLDKHIIDRFLAQQLQLLDILALAKSKNISKTRTKISISKVIKLKLGDTLKVVIYHNKRHIAQAKKLV